MNVCGDFIRTVRDGRMHTKSQKKNVVSSLCKSGSFLYSTAKPDGGTQDLDESPAGLSDNVSVSYEFVADGWFRRNEPTEEITTDFSFGFNAKSSIAHDPRVVHTRFLSK